MLKRDTDALIFLIDDRFNVIILNINASEIPGFKKKYMPEIEKIYKKYDLYNRDLGSMNETELENLYKDVDNLYKDINIIVEKYNFRKQKVTKSPARRCKCK